MIGTWVWICNNCELKQVSRAGEQPKFCVFCGRSDMLVYHDLQYFNVEPWSAGSKEFTNRNVVPYNGQNEIKYNRKAKQRRKSKKKIKEIIDIQEEE